MAQDAGNTKQPRGERRDMDERVYPGAPSCADAAAEGRSGGPAGSARCQRRVAIALATVSALLIVAALAMMLFSGQPGFDGLMHTVAGQGSEPAAVESSDSAGQTAAGSDAETASSENDAADSSTRGGDETSDGCRAATAGSESGSSSAASGDEASGGRSPNNTNASSSGNAKPSNGATNGNAPAQTITVSVVVDASAAGGGTLASTSLTFEPGATVYDALRGTGLSVNARGTAYGTYVAAIGGYAEKEHGGTSGWTYSVNGASPTAACDAYELSNGDVVCWTYVTSN